MTVLYLDQITPVQVTAEHQRNLRRLCYNVTMEPKIRYACLNTVQLVKCLRHTGLLRIRDLFRWLGEVSNVGNANAPFKSWSPEMN